jgi:hypothetical protein
METNTNGWAVDAEAAPMLGVVRDAAGATVCTLGDREDADAQNETAALICAAPEMLLALRLIVAQKGPCESTRRVALARAAIARAEGGAA